MNNILVSFRYFVFVAFIVCNAITCSTAVWNYALSQMAGHILSVDGFIIFVGAAALAFIFPIILIELMRKDPVTARVWFECLWVCFFGVLELCAAASLSAIGPGVMCTAGVMAFVHDSCTSTRVVLAFSWICAILLSVYFLVLTLSTYMHKYENPQIWSCNVRRFDWGGTRTYLGSDAPKSLSLPRFVEKARPGSVIAPIPRHPIPEALRTQPSGISSDHAVQPPRTQRSAERPSLSINTTVPPVHQAQGSREATTAAAASFYPRHMQSHVASQPPLVSQQKREVPRSTSPPPLGDWPRPNIISQPRSKHQGPSRGSTFPPVNQPSSNASRKPSTISRLTKPPTHQRSARSASSSTEGRKIPPPLDLSKISSHTRLGGL